jgi:hypothetical protein
MAERLIRTLGAGGKATEFAYEGNVKVGVTLLFAGKPQVQASFFDAILGHFAGQEVPGGFSMTNPHPHGLGAWVEDNSRQLNGHKLTPRHASFIAAVLQHEGYISSHLDGSSVALVFPSAGQMA